MSNEFELELEIGGSAKPSPKPTEPTPVKTEPAQAPVATPAPVAEVKPTPAPAAPVAEVKTAPPTPTPAPVAEVKAAPVVETKDDDDLVFEPQPPITQRLENWLKASSGTTFLLKASIFAVPFIVIMIILIAVLGSANGQISKLTREKAAVSASLDAKNAQAAELAVTMGGMLDTLQANITALQTARNALNTAIDRGRPAAPAPRATAQQRNQRNQAINTYNNNNRSAITFLRNSQGRVEQLQDNNAKLREILNNLKATPAQE